MEINTPIMARMGTNESKVSIAKAESVSVRTTIPANIAQQMGLETHDILDWKLDKIKGKWIATIEKRGMK